MQQHNNIMITKINTMINPKIHCKSKNNTITAKIISYIPELLTVNSCWNGVNILASHKCGTLVMYHSLSF